MPLIELPVLVICRLGKSLPHGTLLCLVVNVTGCNYRQIFLCSRKCYIEKSACFSVALESHLHLVDVLLERMAPGDIFKVEILSKEAVIPIEHNARQSIFPLVHAACRNEYYEREFKTLTLMDGHCGDLILVGIGHFDICLLDLDLHLLQFIGDA